MTSNNFINECKNRANENRLGKIIVGEEEITNADNLQKIEVDSGCYADGNIIGTIYIKCLNSEHIGLPDNIDLIDKEVEAQIGVKYGNNTTEYISLGKYKVDSPTNEQTANMGKFKAYDLLSSKIDGKYICNVDYSTPKTLRDLYMDVCSNLELTPVTTTFLNSTIPIIANPFTNGEKNRFVLQTIAKIACSYITIDNNNDKIDLSWLSNNVQPDYIFETNDYSTLEGGKIQYGPINSVIIKNSQIDDENVTQTDQASIDEFGEHSLVISEDYILNTAELRQQAMTAIFNRLNGLKYIDSKLTSYYGKPFLPTGAKIRIYKDTENYFDTYVLKHKFTYDGTFNSVIESPALTEQQIETKQNITLGEKLNNTQIKVNKQENSIALLTNEVNDMSNFLVSLQNTNFIRLQTTPNSKNAINKLIIKNFEIQPLYPNMAYPSEYTYPSALSFYTLIFSSSLITYRKALPQSGSSYLNKIYNIGGINGKYYICQLSGDNYIWNEISNLSDYNIREIYINSPIPLQKIVVGGETIYDTIEFSNDILKIIQRIAYNSTSHQYEVLSTPITWNLGIYELPTFETDTYITMKYFQNLNYNCEYIMKNNYTDIYQTKTESMSQLNIQNEKIDLKVSKDGIISQINMSPEEIKILANKLNLTASDIINLISNNSINLTSSHITIDSDYFKVDELGRTIMSSAELTNGILKIGNKEIFNSSGVLTNLQFKSSGWALGQNEDTYAGIDIKKTTIELEVYIPNNFTIVSAILTLDVFKTQNIFIDTSMNEIINYGKVKNIRLYKETISNTYRNTYEGTFGSTVVGEEIPNAFEGGYYTAPTTEKNSKNTIDIKSHLSSGITKLYLQTADSVLPATNAGITSASQQTQLATATLNILGYTKLT